MLKCNIFPFVIDLATWAAKRKFLKLDLWMIEKIKDCQVRENHVLWRHGLRILTKY